MWDNHTRRITFCISCWKTSFFLILFNYVFDFDKYVSYELRQNTEAITIQCFGTPDPPFFSSTHEMIRFNPFLDLKGWCHEFQLANVVEIFRCEKLLLPVIEIQIQKNYVSSVDFSYHLSETF